MGRLIPYSIGTAAILRVIGTENFVPNIKQVTKVGIHVNHIAGMVHTVVRRGKHYVVQKAKPAIVSITFSPTCMSDAPDAIDKHNNKQHGRVYAKQYAIHMVVRMKSA
jgi:hypothetical protein